MKKTYYVTFTYLNTVEAESCEEAENLTEEMIRDGDLVPNDIETEIAKDVSLLDDTQHPVYEYDGFMFEHKEYVIDALVESEEILPFYGWLNENYTASDIYENCFEDLELKYNEYKEDVFIWCLQVGKIKEIK